MTSKTCSNCQYLLKPSEQFCPECGTKHVELSNSTDDGDPYKKYTNKTSFDNKESRSFQNSTQKTVSFDNQGFFSILLGTSEYSVVRAKWFYGKAEGIINIVVLIVLALSALFLLITFFSSPVFGFIQLLTTTLLVGLLFIALIFYKLFLMGIGSVIRIAELTEKSSKKE